MTIVMGEPKAMIGADNIGYEQVMVTHGLGQINENGEMFTNFCAKHSLVIGGSLYFRT